MVGAFLFLIPMVPYATFRATEPESRPVMPWIPAPVVTFPFHPPGSAGDSDGRDNGGRTSPFSARAVRETSRGWEWKGLETPGWKILMAPHFVVRGDVPIDRLRTVGAHLEEFLKAIQDLLGGDISDIMFSARVFSDSHEFRRYAVRSGAPNAESFYDPRSAELVICLAGSPSAAWLQKTLAHEFAHEYMDRVWKRTDPLWFAEGLAEYFSNFAVRDGRMVPGALDGRALLLLRLEELGPLTRFLKLDRGEMYGVTFARHYAQAWSFVHYLFSRKDETIDLLLRGESLKNVEELEKGWLEYLKKLE
jgi:hypothetical protein